MTEPLLKDCCRDGVGHESVAVKQRGGLPRLPPEASPDDRCWEPIKIDKPRKNVYLTRVELIILIPLAIFAFVALLFGSAAAVRALRSLLSVCSWAFRLLAWAFRLLACLLVVVVALACAYFKKWGWPSSVYCQILYLAYQSQLYKKRGRDFRDTRRLTKEKAQELMPIEKMKEKAVLEKYWVPYALNIRVPKDKHEEFKDLEKDTSLKRKIQVKFEENISRWPHKDNPDCFEEGENPVKYVMDRLGSVFPRSYQVWDDKLSDEALTRFCLHGLAAHRVQVEHQGDEKFFVVRTNALAALPVRKGFARYGGDAYFNEKWEPVKIVDEGWHGHTKDDDWGRDGPVKPEVTRPGDKCWQEAKFRFRSSVSVLVTLVDHLYAIHLEAANILVTALREKLSPGHPVRRFLTPFTYQTITVNDNARNNLVNWGSMSPRCFAFTDEGLSMAFNAAGSLVLNGFECDPPKLDRVEYVKYLKEKQGIDTPFWQNAVKYWKVIKKYVERYFEHCYCKEEGKVKADLELMAFFKQIEFQLKNVTPTAAMGLKKWLSCDGKDEYYVNIVDSITFFIYIVTAGHEHVGSVECYVQDPTFCAFKWIPGHMCGTKQTAIDQALLMSFTSLPMPSLLGSDWTHLFDKHEQIMAFEEFQKELADLAEEMTKEEHEVKKKDPPLNFPVYVFNPTYLETSVGV